MARERQAGALAPGANFRLPVVLDSYGFIMPPPRRESDKDFEISNLCLKVKIWFKRKRSGVDFITSLKKDW